MNAEETAKRGSASDGRGESEFVALLQSGDREALAQAVRRFSPKMLVTARAIVGRDDAEDIVQEAWIAVVKQIGGFEGRAALSTWLARIVTNRAISHLRSRAREKVPSGRSAPDPAAGWFDDADQWNTPPALWDSGSPEELLMAGALQDCIEKHILLMPENQRAVLVMRDMQQRSFDEICNELGLSASNTRVLLHRGRLRLMNMIDIYQEKGTC